MTRFAGVLGRMDFYRGKGDPWIEMFRRWLLIGMGASATGKFVFNLSDGWNIAVLVAIPIAGEAIAVLVGWALARSGSITSHYQIAHNLDPSRRLPVERLEEVRDILRDIRARMPARA